jgi:hypothetical protein
VVLALLTKGHSYETAARILKVSPGLVFMVATGVPADGSDSLSGEQLRDPRLSASSTQHLIGPPAFNPTRRPGVDQWVRERAARELEPPSAASEPRDR